MADVLRTPNKLISAVPDFPFKPRYRHTASLAALFADLKLREATIVAHDWGGPIGLRLAVDVGWRFARAIGAQIDHVIPGAGHFVQEDAGPQVGRLIATWLNAQFPRKR